MGGKSCASSECYWGALLGSVPGGRASAEPSPRLKVTKRVPATLAGSELLSGLYTGLG